MTIIDANCPQCGEPVHGSMDHRGHVITLCGDGSPRCKGPVGSRVESFHRTARTIAALQLTLHKDNYHFISAR